MLRNTEKVFCPKSADADKHARRILRSVKVSETWTITKHIESRLYCLLSYGFMRPSSLGGGRILRRTLSVRLSVCLSVCPSVPLLLPSVTWRHLANYNDTHVLFGTQRGPHIVRPSRPHKLVLLYFGGRCWTMTNVARYTTKELRAWRRYDVKPARAARSYFWI